LVFCPSVPHLRAYIATFQPRLLQESIDPKVQNARCDRALIAIVDIIALHYTSTQFSAQGLSQTLALAVETAARTESAIMLCECEDAVNLANRNRGHEVWDLQLPPLNGNTTRSRYAQGSSAVPSRHISVRRVVQRWFRFEE